jgi:hypothetical protein
MIKASEIVFPLDAYPATLLMKAKTPNNTKKGSCVTYAQEKEVIVMQNYFATKNSVLFLHTIFSTDTSLRESLSVFQCLNANAI